MKRLAVLIAVLSFANGSYLTAASGTSPVPSPVLVELFTSEGCSSCPPAEKALEQMDANQPIPGVQLIVLSEHITYFNHEGWKDPYASEALTERQYAYAHFLGLKDVFTPQMLVDGVQELWGKTSQQGEDELRQAAAAPKVPIHISSVTLDPKAGILRGHIDVDGTSERHNADVYAAVALDHAESHVLRGENRGRDLTHVAVVQILRKIGKLKKGTTVDTEMSIKLDPDVASKKLRLVIFAQESGVGKVVGAALQKDIR